jgi:RND family efflux transporter MFP subunit
MSPNNSLLALITTCALLWQGPSLAGPGHDHDHDHGTPAAPQANGPQRLPDGSVFLPKASQRQLNLRTQPIEEALHPRAIELMARVSMDPNSSGKVQAINAGRIAPGPRGLPVPGQRVREGELLATLLPSSGPLEKSSQAAQIAELKAAQTLAEQRLQRLQALADTVPQKEIDAAQAERSGLAQRISALTAGYSSREPLIAPVSGVIASAQVVAGQVVDARELIFEIINPQHFRIEALSFDTTLPAEVAQAFLVHNDRRIPLKFQGAARRLNEQALPLYFSLQSQSDEQLALGQPVRVVVQTATRIKGFAVPASALHKNSANQSIVWVKTAAERFAPRIVTFEPLDGLNVALRSGLAAGDKVVTQGANLLNQVR